VAASSAPSSGLPESNVASQAVSAADACPSTFFCRSAMQTAVRPDGLAHESEFSYDAGQREY